MLFSVAFGVPEKSVFTRLFCVFATVVLANFQNRLAMIASRFIGVAIYPLAHDSSVLSVMTIVFYHTTPRLSRRHEIFSEKDLKKCKFSLAICIELWYDNGVSEFLYRRTGGTR